MPSARVRILQHQQQTGTTPYVEDPIEDFTTSIYRPPTDSITPSQRERERLRHLRVRTATVQPRAALMWPRGCVREHRLHATKN